MRALWAGWVLAVRLQWKVVPGRYQLELGAAPLGAGSQLTLRGATGAAGGPEPVFALSKTQNSVSTEIVVGEKVLSLSVSEDTDLRWLSPVEIPAR